MQFREIAAPESVHRLLGASIFSASGRKLWGKGHRLAEADVELLLEQGIDRVWIVDLEDDEMPEAEVALCVARCLQGGASVLKEEPGGRASILATQTGVVTVEANTILGVNQSGFAVVATRAHWTLAGAGERIATVKSRPFAVPRRDFDGWSQAQGGSGPAVRLWPLPAAPRVGVVFADPVNAARGPEHLADAVRQRLCPYGAVLSTTAVREETPALMGALEAQLRGAPAVIIVASTHAPSGPEDPIGQAICGLGGRIGAFLVPVDPGALLLLGWLGKVPVLSVPSGFRNLRPNVIDIVLPALLAGCPAEPDDFARLGPGGLME